MESQLDRVRHGDERFLFVNWMTLRNPVAEFTAARARLPNQEVPGLGLARESGELLALMAQRLDLAGVAVRPAAFHVAYTARYDFEFADPDRDARFRKLVQDLKPYSLADVTRAIDARRGAVGRRPLRLGARLDDRPPRAGGAPSESVRGRVHLAERCGP